MNAREYEAKVFGIDQRVTTAQNLARQHLQESTSAKASKGHIDQFISPLRSFYHRLSNMHRRRYTKAQLMNTVVRHAEHVGGQVKVTTSEGLYFVVFTELTASNDPTEDATTGVACVLLRSIYTDDTVEISLLPIIYASSLEELYRKLPESTRQKFDDAVYLE